MQDHIEARVVVQHGQRVITYGVGGEVALEVHLPQCIGRLVLEARPRRGRLAGQRVDQAVPAQHRVRGTGGHLHAFVALEHVGNLASAPGRMLGTKGHYPRFPVRWHPRR